MDDHYVTGTELIVIIAAGVLLPFLVVSFIQIRLFLKYCVPKLAVVLALLFTFILSVILGIYLWSAFPLLTVSWQHLVLSAANPVLNTLAFVPLVPMLFSSVLVAIPVALLALRWRGDT